jgi:hypothetical protein
MACNMRESEEKCIQRLGEQLNVGDQLDNISIDGWDNVKVDLKEIRWKCASWIDLARVADWVNVVV